MAASEWMRRELGFEPDAAQARVIDSESRRLALNCTRQWGKSTVTAAKAVHHAQTNAGSLTLVVSPSARQSGEFVRKAEAFARRLKIRPKGDGDNEISLAFPNGSRLVGLPGNEATVRGFSAVSLLVVDEAARVSDELYWAIRPMLAVSAATASGSGCGCRRRSAGGFRRSFWKKSAGRWASGGSGRSICASSWTR